MRYADYCGPGALAEYTGLSREMAAQLLRRLIKRHNGRRVRAGTEVQVMIAAVRHIYGAVSVKRKLPRGQRTLIGWLRTHPDARAIVHVSHHYVVVDQCCIVAGKGGLHSLRSHIHTVIQ